MNSVLPSLQNVQRAADVRAMTATAAGAPTALLALTAPSTSHTGTVTPRQGTVTPSQGTPSAMIDLTLPQMPSITAPVVPPGQLAAVARLGWAHQAQAVLSKQHAWFVQFAAWN